MTLTSTVIACGLRAKATPTGELNTSPATIGSLTEHRPTIVSPIIYAIKITSAATGNVATLTAATGDCAQTTGSPAIIGAGVNFQAQDLGTATKIHGIRLRSSGTGTVTIAGSSSGKLPAIVLESGMDVVVKYPDAGTTLAGSETLTATFSAAAGILEIEALAKV